MWQFKHIINCIDVASVGFHWSVWETFVCRADLSSLFIFMNYYTLQHSIPSEKASEMSELQPDATEPNLSHRHTEAFHSKSRIQKIRALICWSRETHICSYMRNGLIKQLEANAERHFSVFAIFHWSDPIRSQTSIITAVLTEITAGKTHYWTIYNNSIILFFN